MKNTILITFCITIFTSINLYAQNEIEENAIKEVLNSSYVQAVFVEFNEEAIRAGFHEDFQFHVPMRTPSGISMRKIELERWLTMLKNMSFSEIESKVLEVHVTDGAATTVSEIYQQGKKLYTDYMIWQKIEDRWVIMGKTFAFHQQRSTRQG